VKWYEADQDCGGKGSTQGRNDIHAHEEPGLAAVVTEPRTLFCLVVTNRGESGFPPRESR